MQVSDLEKRIIAKELEVHHRFVSHKDGTKTPYTQVGYLLEDQMLADFMTWAKNEHPQIRKSIFHIENEGDRSSDFARFKGAQSLSKGKLKGVFDVCCVYEGRLSFAEFKLKGGSWSKEQVELRDLWGDWAIPIIEITNFADWKYYIRNFVLRIVEIKNNQL